MSSHLDDWNIDTVSLAIRLHNKYEELAKEELWQTQKSCRHKNFAELPFENQRVMLRLADWMINEIFGEKDVSK